MIFKEEKFKKYIQPHLKRCRPGDWEHSLRVVKWIKRLGKEREDLQLLVIAGYLHDIGWRDVIQSEKMSIDQLDKKEAEGESRSAQYITEILNEFNFNNKDIAKIIRCVKAADNQRANADDEAIVVDADNLSKLNVDHLREKYEPDSWMDVVKQRWVADMVNRVTTEKGKQLWPKMLEDLKRELK